ncbi:HXXEE domain-containing protein [candidate division KSB1 bacterium]|nr:HXXEE domain-containing protein [candidate division KSB1 bacterium]
MENKTTTVDMLSKKDLVIGTVIAIVMAAIFSLLSSGMSLIVTFVPGIAFAWLAYVWLYAKQTKLPNSEEFLPLFFALLAVQFIHFAEEFTTAFRVKFPLLYGGVPYSDNLFVTFNMVAYFIFTVACLLAFTKNLKFLLVPVLFYIVYGAIGNAISHTWWSLYLRSYFPGLVTAQIYWIAGPFVLCKLLGSRKPLSAIMLLFALVLVALLTIFASPTALGAK